MTEREALKKLTEIDTATTEEGVEMLVKDGLARDDAERLVTQLSQAWQAEVAPLIEVLSNYEENEVTDEEAEEVFRKLGQSTLLLSALADSGVLFVQGTMKILEVTEDRQGVRLIDIVSAANHPDKQAVQQIPIHLREIDPLIERLQELKAELTEQDPDEAREEIKDFFRDLGVEL